MEHDRELAEDWLRGELSRVWLIAERCLRQHQLAGLRPEPHDPTLAEIEALLAARRRARGAHEDPDDAELEEALAESEAALALLRGAAPIRALVDRLGLRPLELETLVFALAPVVDAPLVEMFALLRGPTANRAGVDLALVTQLLQLNRSDRLALLDVIDEDRPLLGWRMIRVAPEAFSSPAHRAIQPVQEVMPALLGASTLPSQLQGTATVIAGADPENRLVLDAPIAERLDRLSQAVGRAAERGTLEEVPWVVLWGPAGVGKATVAAKVAAAAGRPLLRFAPGLVEPGQIEELFRAAYREALIRGAAIYLGPLTAELLAGAARPLVRILARQPTLTFLGIESLQPPRLKLPHGLQEIALSIPAEPSRLQLWEREIPAETCGEGVDLPSLARGYSLTPGEILATAKEAKELAGVEGGRLVEQRDLRAGVERRLRNELGDIARRLTVTARWEDLVLPPADLGRVEEFINRKRFADRVYIQWGLGRRLSYGQGMVALFTGPPGTGKTMLAGLIANALDLDLYQVDISQVMSKWVGETEKQLSRVFDHAERANAVLLFDEADSLFSKRTEVDSSMDRYGNMATNYLLQRLEQYTGVGILASNKDASLDDALRRRLSLHIRLDVPAAPERERLWHSFLVSSLPMADDIDCRSLARDYELTGGYIKNIVLRAAFLAAAEERLVDGALLRRAAVLEMEDMGRVVAERGGQELPAAATGAELRSGDEVSDFTEG